MDALRSQGLDFTPAVVPSDGVAVINAFTIGGNTYLADLTNQCYDLGKNPDADFAFWFWSVNGTAGPNTPPMGTVSYKGYPLAPNDTVYWQLLAPDQEYKFAKCEAHPQNHYAKAQEKATEA